MKLFLLLSIISIFSFGQGIWKDYREMQESERQEYIKVLNALHASGVRQNFVNSHINFAQHSNDDFLPWHRMMLYYFVREAKAVNKYFNQGYFNCYTDILSSSLLFKNYTGGFDGLLGHSIDWSFNRFQNSSSSSIGNYNNNLNQISFLDFRSTIEQNPHNNVHVTIGTSGTRLIDPGNNVPPFWATVQGDMSIVATSPRDPTFYFHHAMVDKVWADWVKTSWNGSDFGNVTDGNIPSLNSTSVYNGRQIFDPRSLKLWYADNGRVVLDKYTASHQTLGNTTGPEFYFYTGLITVAGSMTNFFTVPAGVEAKIESLSQIAILPGFSAPNGSYFGASSIGAFPTTPDQVFRKEAAEEKEPKKGFQAITIYPNSNDGTFTLKLPEGELIFNMWITSALGNLTNYSRINDFEISLINAPYGTYNIDIQSNSGKKYSGRVVVNQ